MEKQIRIDNTRLKYTLKTSQRATNLRLTINSNGCLVVTKPEYLSDQIAENFIIQKSAWVFKKIEYVKQFSSQGTKHVQASYADHKDKALKFINDKLKHFNGLYGFKYHKISVRNQKTRWGSCSAKGNLNFNYKILFLPEKLADYIIVHELCHLEEMNHSPKFWNLVANEIPDYLSRRKELRKSSLLMNLG